MIPYLFGISPGSMKHMYNQFNAVSDDPYQIDGLFQKTETGAKLRLTDEAADYIVEHLDQEKKISIKYCQKSIDNL